MSLSVIIVNYNVKYFLEQCLYSLRKGCAGLKVEVIVVDNQSVDGSIEYLRPLFPEVHFIYSENNIGFARACNLGLQHASGNYILFLNPDTLVAEDTFEQCLRFFEQHPDAGAIGVRMIDGTGTFLKESKRAFPSPLTSLFKLFGLSMLFPRSKLFSRYHLGHLSEFKNHKVDVLAGAFMMIRKEVLDKVGSFDETFFMYGEDIDLSYRIQKEGYANYYVADTTIIHFKGESTKRGSLNYVRLFYKAMSLFVKKHYGGTQAGLFNAAIHSAIWVRALIAGLFKLVKGVGLPVLDALFFFSAFWVVKWVWITLVKPGYVYPDKLLWLSFSLFTVVYLLIAYYTGLFNRSYRWMSVVKSILLSTLILLAGYSLLPEQLRFSRGIVLFGTLLALVCITLLRFVFVKAGVLQLAADTTSRPFLLIAGTNTEYEEVKTLLAERGLKDKIIGRLSVGDEGKEAIATLKNVSTFSTAMGAKELILCAGFLSYKEIITIVQGEQNGLRNRFHAKGSGSIVGSDSKHSTGEVLSAETMYKLAQPHNKRLKRLVDVLTAFFLLFSLPLHLFGVKRPGRLVQNCFAVLSGRKTWIGYSINTGNLPVLRPPVITITGPLFRSGNHNSGRTEMIDYWYARNYKPVQDVKLILKNYKYLGT